MRDVWRNSGPPHRNWVPCWLSAMSCSELLQAAYIPWHVAAFHLQSYHWGHGIPLQLLISPASPIVTSRSRSKGLMYLGQADPDRKSTCHEVNWSGDLITSTEVLLPKVLLSHHVHSFHPHGGEDIIKEHYMQGKVRAIGGHLKILPAIIFLALR